MRMRKEGSPLHVFCGRQQRFGSRCWGEWIRKWLQ
ncbi:hypothetical protein H310_14745 [Aphanomyces invadans]|uniref:Uncharacterized protein n=1 Tax=Aphanomyces invadans TaxID=157072 RepID=A0A024T8L6_9STRA|nr:hypothetical protein H310_14745 [Aphanomyces invadans]ETV90465.1 hypothetical protein H310_14745 [Aphanomyces invadans]|eukprot:XP_008880893.1 hypothetical protein H310_14745 [Aphanomyces invadans]